MCSGKHIAAKAEIRKCRLENGEKKVPEKVRDTREREVAAVMK